MKLVLVGIRNHVLNFHKRVQGLSPLPRLPLQSRENAVWPGSSPFFRLLYSPFFYPQRTLSSVSISRGILLPTLRHEDEPATQHILRRSAVLEIRRVRLGCNTRRRIVARRTFDRENARDEPTRQRLRRDWSAESTANIFRRFANRNDAGV